MSDEAHGVGFFKLDSDESADVVLRQRDATYFDLVEAFRYVGPERAPGDDPGWWVVPRGNVSDLASIPHVLTWLIPRYGRHTLPALLHDHLDDHTTMPKARADDVFRDTMALTHVPFVRRWLMWGAVALVTLGRSSRAWWLLVGWWVAVYGGVLGLAPLWWAVGWISFPGLLMAGALGVLSVFVTSLLWGRRYWLATMLALASLVLAVPLVSILVATGVYAAAEQVVRLLGLDTGPVLSRNLEPSALEASTEP